MPASSAATRWWDYLSQRTLGVERALWLVWAATIVAYVPSLAHAAFLSDDVAILGGIHAWQHAGQLWSRVATLFFEQLPTGNHYYRPLPFVSFALDFTLFGVKALGWHVCNLALHLLSIACVYGLANRLLRQSHAPAGPAPLVAALLFALSPVGPEVVIWIAGRYDAMATAAVLSSLYLLVRSRNGHDQPAVAGWCVAVIGLMSKESAAVIVPISALVVLRKVADRHTLGGDHLGREFLQQWLPFLALAAAYVLLRWYLFGGPFQVYASRPVVWEVDLGLALRSIWQWFGGLVPQAAVRWLIAVLVPAVLMWVACRAKSSSQAAWVTLGAVIAALIAIGLVLPHKSAFAATGEDARFFYTSSAFIALALAAAVTQEVARRGIGSVATTLVWVILGISTVATVQNIERWAAASDTMRALLQALHAEASTLPPNAYALVLIPDHLGSVPFGRNAQGGLVQPPLQPMPLSAHLVPTTPGDLAQWYAKLQSGILPALRAHSLEDVSRSALPAPVSPMPARFVPTHYFCWKPAERSLVKLSGIDASDASRWKASWRRALAAAGCEGLERSVR